MRETYHHRTTYQCSVCQGRTPNDWCSTCGGTGMVDVYRTSNPHKIDWWRISKTGFLVTLYVVAFFVCEWAARIIWGTR